MALPAGSTKWLGATPAEGGTHFAFYTAAAATRVELCLFDKATGEDETQHLDFNPEAREAIRDDEGKLIGYIWNGFAEGVHAGALYGFRVHGPYNPENREFFNPNKLLVDPCAKAVTHEIHRWEACNFPYNQENNGKIMPKARVVDWQALQRNALEDTSAGALHKQADTNILAMHVKGGTILHEGIKKEECGKYKALESDAFIDWVQEMDFTSVELMPVESFGTDPRLAGLSKNNYWGYMTMAPMAPHTGYAATDMPEKELAESIKKLKKKGIEVILDIVPNHTLESKREDGPVINLRGMDDKLYQQDDYTGTGNTRDFGHPINRRMFLEELKYWRGLGVSGFRIDLATILGRVNGADFSQDSPMMTAIRKDKDLEDIKLYGEPWDLGHNGVQSGQLAYTHETLKDQPDKPVTGNCIAEWDDDVRNTMQAAMKRGSISRSELINRLAGSSGRYGEYKKNPDNKDDPGEPYGDPQSHAIAIGTHDGSTPHDFVTYKDKHNLPNGEDNRDGNDGGDNWGHEGETDNAEINANRLRSQSFATALLAVSQGVHMMYLGHDRDHTQQGNTNAYCQDNETTHILWDDKKVSPAGLQLMELNRVANKFRHDHAALRRGAFFTGQADEQSGLSFNGKTIKDVTWLDPFAEEMDSGKINQPGGFAMLLSGDPGNSPGYETRFTRLIRRKEHDSPLLVLINPTMEDNMEFTLPDVPGITWKPVLNSLNPGNISKEPLTGNQKIKVGFHSLIAFEGSRLIEKGSPAYIRS